MNKVIKVIYKGSYCGDEDISDESFIHELKEFDWLIYTYGTGSYEGDGVCIYKKDGKYHQANLGHCSCYGPMDNLYDKSPKDSIEEIIKECSNGLNNELKPLIEELEKHNEIN